MIFAELDANGWAVVIAAVFLGIAQILSMLLSYRREQNKIQRDAEVAEKVELVKVTTEATNVEHGATLAEIKSNTNGNLDELRKANADLRKQMDDMQAKALAREQGIVQGLSSASPVVIQPVTPTPPPA